MNFVIQKLRRWRSLEGRERRVLVAAALRLPWFWVRLRLFGQLSGVFGLFNQDGAAVSRGELESMASLLERRGPDRTEPRTGARISRGWA